MKAEIDEYGCLTVKAETPLESYALARWHEGWDMPYGQQKSVLCIDVPVRDAPSMTTQSYAVPANPAVPSNAGGKPTARQGRSA